MRPFAMRAGEGRGDAGALIRLLIGWIDHHHTAIDTLAAVNERELALGAAVVAEDEAFDLEGLEFEAFPDREQRAGRALEGERLRGHDTRRCLVAAGGLAAALSTADGLLLAIANALSHDVYYNMIDHKASTGRRLIGSCGAIAWQYADTVQGNNCGQIGGFFNTCWLAGPDGVYPQNAWRCPAAPGSGDADFEMLSNKNALAGVLCCPN